MSAGLHARQQQKAATAAKILKAAKEHFEQVGYLRASFRTLADAAGVSVATIFNHFPGKEKLYKAATGRDAPDLADFIRHNLATLPGAVRTTAEGLLQAYEGKAA